MDTNKQFPGKIFLLGLPGCGKSTVGKALAKSLGIPFVDLDEEIERAEGMPVKDIFKSRKENYFREVEARELNRLSKSETSWVMATGGGTPCFFDNIEVIKRSGTSIFLDVPARTITERIMKAPLAERPLFASTHPDELKDKVEWMRTHRLEYYKQADLMLTGSSISTDEILLLLKGHSKG